MAIYRMTLQLHYAHVRRGYVIHLRSTAFFCKYICTHHLSAQETRHENSKDSVVEPILLRLRIPYLRSKGQRSDFRIQLPCPFRPV